LYKEKALKPKKKKVIPDNSDEFTPTLNVQKNLITLTEVDEYNIHMAREFKLSRYFVDSPWLILCIGGLFLLCLTVIALGHDMFKITESLDDL